MNDDDQLRRLLSDAVSDVEPESRLDEVRASVHPSPKVVPMSRSRSWYAAAGIVATAAVIGIVAYVTSVAGDKTSTIGPATDSGTPGPTATATDTAAPTPSPSGDTKAYAVYYVGTDPKDKPVLYREFHRAEKSKRAGALAVGGLQTTPLDPDYSTPWHAGDLTDAKADPDAGVIFVTLGRAALEHRPEHMTPAYARAAVQQVVYTCQAAFGARLPVQFMLHGAPAQSLLGVPASKPIAQDKVLDTLSHISISNPNQGETVSGTLHVTGVNNGFEGTVGVYLQQNGKHYLTQATIGGTYEDRLFPWEVDLDLSKVTPGTYTLVARNDDPSGRNKPEIDTRVIVLK